MNKYFIKLRFLIVMISFGLFTAQAKAEDTGLQSIAKGINQLVQDAKGKWAATLKLLYEKTPYVEQTIVGNTHNVDDKAKNINPYANLDPNNLLARDLHDALQPASVYTNPKSLTSLPGSDLNISVDSPGFFHSGNVKDKNPNNAVLNFDSVLLPASYQTLEQKDKIINQQDLAKNYLQFLYQGSKISNDQLLDLSNLSAKQTQKLLRLDGFSDYVLTMRSYAANQSLAMSNLYTMYNNRIPVTDLGNKLGLKQADVSIKQAEQYLASRRIASSDWYYNMEKAAPATVMREILYVLAEIRYELYQSRQDAERNLATLSAIELQNLTQSPLQLRLAKDKAVAAAKDLNIVLSSPASN
jgi:hypothetical protein